MGIYMRIFFSLFMLFASSLLYAETTDWMDRQVEEVFAQFRNGITLADINQAEQTLNSDAVHRFKIINSEVFGRESPVKETLKEICAEFPVPDVDFLYVWGDWMGSNGGVKAPIFTGAAPRGTKGIILFEDWYTRLCNWNHMAEQTNAACLNSPWEMKINKLFWRGSGTDAHYSINHWKTPPRGKLVYYSTIYPDLIDAGFFHFHPWHVDNLDQFWKVVGKKELLPLEEVPNYKYSIDLDGTTCSYPGFMWKLLMNVVVFKQDSEHEMYFYRQTKPWVHYIPVKRDLSDLLEKLAWAMKHDDEARKIAENGREFALSHLMRKPRLLYFYKVLVKYASLQKFKPA